MVTVNKNKTFILDTNVILHDSSCINHFDEHDVVVPITVLEELDHFKKGNQTLNFHAREFVRALDNLSANKLFNGGVSIGTGRGRISIKLEQELHPDLRQHFPATAKPDHQILNIGYQLAHSDTSRSYILVTKDVNFRMKAKAVGLMAEDYTSDHVKDVRGLYTGCRCIENVDHGLVEELYRSGEGIKPDRLESDNRLLPNEYLILRNGKKSVLSTFRSQESVITTIRKRVFTVSPLVMPSRVLPFTPCVIWKHRW